MRRSALVVLLALAALLAACGQAATPTPDGWESREVGGKTVQTIGIEGFEAIGTFYVYVNGDTLYYTVGSAELASEAIAQLP